MTEITLSLNPGTLALTLAAGEAGQTLSLLTPSLDALALTLALETPLLDDAARSAASYAAAQAAAAAASAVEAAEFAAAAGAADGFGPTMAAWFNSLPTSLPAEPGVPWNNGGLLALS